MVVDYRFGASRTSAHFPMWRLDPKEDLDWEGPEI